MQEKPHPQHETIFIGMPAETLELLDRVQAGMGSVLSLLEIESERSEGCHGVHCLLTMIKMELDQVAEALNPEAESS